MPNTNNTTRGQRLKEFARGRSAAAWRPPRPPQQQSTIAAEAGEQEEEHLCTQNQNLLLMAGEHARAVQSRRFGVGWYACCACCIEAAADTLCCVGEYEPMRAGRGA
jgi:hypothetical protein